ncbi:small ribosomal subunit protein uS14-like [Capricornis sumatraensis]|uniref:small ribosomal subunit protein uS14-like n=1 Tax=Capricornis sumatraensis TaxID=34865 RepID=UPI0036048892
MPQFRNLCSLEPVLHNERSHHNEKPTPLSRESDVGHQQLYWGHLRNFSEGSRSCWVCSNRHGLIRKHCLSMGHQYFRQYMKDVGCVKSD